MNGTTASGGSLRRVAHAEAVALSGGLLRYAESHPQVVEQPLFVLLTRLLASIPTEEGEIADLQGRLSSALGEIDILREDATTRMAQEAAEKAQKTAEKAQKDRDEVYDAILDLERQVKDAEGRMEEALVHRDEAIQSRDAALAAVRKASDDAGTLLRAKDKDISDLQARIDDLEERLEKVIGKKDQAQTYLEDLRGRVREAQQLLQAKQWGARHRTHRDRNGAAKCCPSCGRLSTEYNHRDAGHAPGCIFPLVEKALSPSK